MRLRGTGAFCSGERLKTALAGFVLTLSLLLLTSVSALAGAIRTSGLATELAGNDDGSTPAVSIGFPINFYGTTFTSLYVNNNGCVTLDSAQSTYTPYGLDGTSRIIIAPFFADVDTRNSNNLKYGTGLVDGRSAFFVDWLQVGYFDQHNSPLNSFQLVIINRSDIASGDFDIEFNYNTIRWETGDASGGSGGLGGSSARVGFSCGSAESGKYYEMPGSGVNGAFLDGGSRALAAASHNSTVSGRHLFLVRNGSMIALGRVPVAVFSLLLDDTPFSYYLNGYTDEATDYKAAALRPASPKHVLSSTDSINFEFRGRPGKANYYLATVRSSVSTSPVSFYLKERDDAPGVYRNPLPIRLSTADSQGTEFHTVKFKEEDTLTTTVTTPAGSTAAKRSIRLDMGEYASCGISVFFPDATTVHDEMNDLDWFSAGYEEFNDSAGTSTDPDHLPIQNFIKHAGSGTAGYGEADFLHFTSHGNYDGRLQDDNTGSTILTPSAIDPSQDMNQDLEWVFINACNTLNHDSTGLDDWMDVLTGTTHPVHGLLGFDEPASADLSSEIRSLFSRLGSSSSPETYLNAYFNAMTSGLADEPCAMVAHSENVNDTLKVLTQDSVNNSYKYYWYDTSGLGGTSHEETILKLGDGTKLRSVVDVDAISAPALRPVTLKRKDFGEPPEGYAGRDYQCGLVTFDRKGSRLASVAQDEAKASEMAVAEMGAAFGELPEDAYKVGTGVLSMQGLTWQHGVVPEGGEVQIARVIHYVHYIDGILVAGDMLTATVSGDTVIKMRGNWHELVSSKAVSGDMELAEGRLIKASTAVEYALSGLGRRGKGKAVETDDVLLEEAELCYYGFQDSGRYVKTYRPTWRFRFKNNNKRENVYIDAASGYVRPEGEVTEAMRRIR